MRPPVLNAILFTPIVALVLHSSGNLPRRIAIRRIAPSLSVTPKGDTLSNYPTQPSQFVFEVDNSGTQAIIHYTAHCIGAGATSCTLNKSVDTIAAGGSKLVRMNFTASDTPGDTARLYMVASDGPPTTSIDSGYIRLTVKGGLVAVSPHVDSSVNVVPNQVNKFVEYTISNTGNLSATDAISFSCSGPAVASCSVSATTLTISAGGTAKDTVFYTSGGPTTSGTIQLWAVLGTTPVRKDSGLYTIRTQLGFGVAVTPDGGKQYKMTAASAQKTIFTIQNTGSLDTTYTVSVDCSVAPISGSCALSSSSLRITAGSSKPDTVSFTAGSAGSAGRMILSASVLGFSPTVRDTGWVDLTVQGTSGQGAPIINLKGLNSGTIVERGACLTIAVGANAAGECGDLRIVHALPSFRTMNVVRTPTLIYHSNHGEPVGQVAVDVTLPDSTAVPDNVIATLTVGGVQKATGTWTGSEWQTVKTRRVALWYADLDSLSKIVPYTVSISTKYGSTTYAAPSVSDTLIIVSRLKSPYGAGWWLDGVEQYNPTTKLWVGGDGSARKYDSVSTTAYVARSYTYADTIKKVGSEYWRLLPDSARVVFDANGRHTKTVNRLGHQMTFYWGGSGLLDSIAPPIQSNGVRIRWRFYYVSGTTTDSVYVTDDWQTGPRVLKIYKDHNTNRVTSIRDPDNLQTQFSYWNIAGTAFITERVDKRAAHQMFQYSGYGKLYHTALSPVVTTDSITHDFWMAENNGLTGAAVPGSVDTAAVSTFHDGPRPAGVGDSMRVWVDRFGAPLRIRAPDTSQTILTRGNDSYPGLVTRVRSPIGSIVGAVYDTRGRLTSTVDSTNSNAKTTYSWDSKWDQITGVHRPMGDRDSMSVDATTGLRNWQQDGRGDSTRVNFTYDGTYRQLTKLQGPGTRYQALLYDFQGNLFRTEDTLGIVHLMVPDNRGEVIYSRTDSVNTILVTDSMAYDAMGRDTLNLHFAGGDTVLVRKRRDAEGNVRSLVQRLRPDPAGIDSLFTQWLFDTAGRMIVRTAPDGKKDSTNYDLAGNVVLQWNRRGKAVEMVYDQMNRLRKRTIPADTIAVVWGGNWSDSLYLDVEAQADTFAYTRDGQVALANNTNANLSFFYAVNGLLDSTQTSIRTQDRAGFGLHNYTVIYGYDQNRRRISMTAPGIFGSSFPVHWNYDPTWGGLTSIRTFNNDLVSFTYSSRNDLLGIKYSDSLRRSLRYDSLGRVVRDSVINVGTAFPRWPSTTLRSQTFTYSARDQIVTNSDPSSYFKEQTQATYSGLGYLTQSALSQAAHNPIPNDTSYHVAGSTYTYDPLGNLRQLLTRDSTKIGGGALIETRTSTDTLHYEARTGRLLLRKTFGGTATPQDISYFYDDDGNTRQEIRATPGTNNSYFVRGALYDALNRLVASLDRVGDGTSHAALRTDSTAIRYDALGRRIWYRVHPWCEEGGSSTDVACLLAAERRTVWDGDQVLGEIQGVHYFANENWLDADADWRLLWVNSSVDLNPYLGRVLYTPGLTIDEPLSVLRTNYRDAIAQDESSNGTLLWPTVAFYPFWNSTGQPTFGAFSDGAAFRPYQMSGGQTACPPRNSTGHDRCLIIEWPFGYSAYDQGHSRAQRVSWHGALLEASRDANGFQDKRNRYYDPATGRFAQEDPIGLAGGLNLYGFANGDPINFSDPFGLQGCRDHPNTPTCKDAIASMGVLHDPIFNLLLFVFTAGGSSAARAALATREARALGEAGEAAAEIIKNTERIPSATGSAAWRIPDALTTIPPKLTEVKNVARLSLTNQIRDFAAFAEKSGRVFELVIRRDTKLTAPLLDFIREKGIEVRYLP